MIKLSHTKNVYKVIIQEKIRLNTKAYYVKALDFKELSSILIEHLNFKFSILEVKLLGNLLEKN